MYRDKINTENARTNELAEGRRIVDEDIKNKRAYDKFSRITKKQRQEQYKADLVS